MVQIIQQKPTKIQLQKGTRIIERNITDYKKNIKVWEFRGFKPVQDVVKEVKEIKQENVVQLKPKKKNIKKKKDEQIN